MRTYENLLLPVDEWYVTSTMDLHDDGFFRYHETWSCYAGSASGQAEGQWRQTNDEVLLETRRTEGALLIGLTAGEKFRAFERADGLDFGNEFIMKQRPDKSAD